MRMQNEFLESRNEMSAMNIVYPYQGHLYVNMTNRCTNRCKFCIRFTPSGVDGIDLWLEHEPETEEIISALEEHDFQNCDQIVFCGYGEPLLRAEQVFAAARYIKENSKAAVRINTNGHANRYFGQDITPQMQGLVDVVSISLNAKNSREYQEICVCDYGEEGFYAMLDFAQKAKKHVPHVVLSVVDVISPEDIEACRKIAAKTGVEFRVREYSE